jgi:hypothetical protein
MKDNRQDRELIVANLDGLRTFGVNRHLGRGGGIGKLPRFARGDFAAAIVCVWADAPVLLIASGGLDTAMINRPRDFDLGILGAPILEQLVRSRRRPAGGHSP